MVIWSLSIDNNDLMTTNDAQNQALVIHIWFIPKGIIIILESKH